jgi:hypothetical protein
MTEELNPMREFFEAMRLHLPEGSRILFCQFRGDPETDSNWAAKILNNPDALDEGANVYLCVSAMKKTSQGWKRRKDNFAGGLLLMIDDLGDGPGSKFPLKHIEVLPPTALIETSPGNHQAIYMFNEAITDERKFNALIDAFVDAQFLEKDPGMKGVTRVFRPPFGVNGKAKYRDGRKQFQVTMKEWNFKRRYSYDQICAAFGLRPMAKAEIKRNVYTKDVVDRTDAFLAAYRVMKRLHIIKGQDEQDHQWVHIHCPWTHFHTNGVDNGAGITQPSEENGWYGGFKCHHGSCSARGWSDLTDYLLDLTAQELEDANEYWRNHDGQI